jgi:hypothetical protein
MPRYDCYAVFFELSDFESLPDSLVIKGFWLMSGMYGEIPISLCTDDTTQESWVHFPGDTILTVHYYDGGGTLEDTVLIDGINVANDQSFWLVIDYTADGIPFYTSGTNPPPYRNILRFQSTKEWISDVDDWSVGLLVVYESAGISGNDQQNIPKTFTLYQNFPNPFNPSTIISFELPTTNRISLKIYDFRGKLVKTLIKEEVREAGYHEVLWDGKNSEGKTVPSGIYLFQLQAGKEIKTRKMVLLK